jgi:hypothetical protein
MDIDDKNDLKIIFLFQLNILSKHIETIIQKEKEILEILSINHIHMIKIIKIFIFFNI